MLKFRLNLIICLSRCAFGQGVNLNSSTKANVIYITLILKSQWILSKMWYNIFLNSVTVVKDFLLFVRIAK